MLANGFSANTICNNHDKATALHFATLSDNYEACKTLINHGLNVNSVDNNGNTCYYYAVFRNKMNIIKLLEENGGDATIANKDNISPIDLSVLEGKKSVTEYIKTQPKYDGYDFDKI